MWEKQGDMKIYNTSGTSYPNPRKEKINGLQWAVNLKVLL
jgi:hypothetical protein